MSMGPTPPCWPLTLRGQVGVILCRLGPWSAPWPAGLGSALPGSGGCPLFSPWTPRAARAGSEQPPACRPCSSVAGRPASPGGPPRHRHSHVRAAAQGARQQRPCRASLGWKMKTDAGMLCFRANIMALSPQLLPAGWGASGSWWLGKDPSGLLRAPGVLQSPFLWGRFFLEKSFPGAGPGWAGLGLVRAH